VLAAYANHWTLVTGPEDWWFTIIRRLAMAIDMHAKKRNVRNFFVSHEGKKELTVSLGSNIYSPDYNGFFRQMTNLVADNLKKPEYVSNMRPDFSTTGQNHRIVANVAIMSSLQEFFSYTAGITCGVPRVEMKGTEQDWSELHQKFKRLSNLMEPIKTELELSNIRGTYTNIRGWGSQRVVDWWSSVDKVLAKLVDTYRGNPDLEWWKGIIKDESSGGCGGPVIDIKGWFMSDLLVQSYEEASSGLGSVPLKLTDYTREEQAAVVAGIAGFRLKEQGDGNYSVEASHDWALMLLPNSYFRSELAEWETNDVDLSPNTRKAHTWAELWHTWGELWPMVQ
jgi:hypothetical protein